MAEKRIALFIISVSSIIVWDIMTRLNIIGGKIQSLLVLISLMGFVYSSFKLLTDFKFESSYFKFIFTLFFLYQIVIILRGFNLSYNDVKGYIQTYYIFWPFVIPLFVFFTKDLVSFGYLFKWIYYTGVFFLIIMLFIPTIVLKRVTAEAYITMLVPCGFLLLNATYLRNGKVNISFLIISISILALTYLARRSATVTLMGFIMASYFLNIFNKSKAKIFRYFPLIVIIGAIILFSQFFESSKEVLLNKMTLRITEDTRSGVFELFFYHLRNDMAFGNGMNGVYYCPLWESEIDGEFFGAVEYRNLIENGYLQLLLTGGIVHIVLFALVLLPAALRGIFMSSNQFVKACGLVILLRLIDMFLYGVPSLNLPYILVWISVGVCYKTSLRRMTNDEVMSEFNKIGLL